MSLVGVPVRLVRRVRYLNTRSVLVAAWLVLGCGPSASSILATLPSEAGGVTFDLIQVVDEGYQGGHPIDDVLAALGKTRRDAIVAFRESQRGDGGVGAVYINGITGAVLLDAVVQHWAAASVIARTELQSGGHTGWLLEHRAGHFTFAYERGDSVYLAMSYDRDRVDAFAAVLP